MKDQLNKYKIGIVVSDTYKEITSAMLEVAKEHSKFLGADVVRIINVPGSFEVPLAVKTLFEKENVEGVVTLGAVIEGDTDHDTVVAQNAARKIMDLSLEYKKPVGLGISGPKMTRNQALKRIDKFGKSTVEAVVKQIQRLQ
ncbi:MAG: 6,7-dimethyl-8-ribityllumazine synthase [Nanoarchaeota archaeon]